VRWVSQICVSVLVIGAHPHAQQQPRPLPTLPLTQLDERSASAELDNHTLSLSFAQPQPIRDALLAAVRGTNLSVAPDPGVAGAFAGELKNVTVRQALEAMLPPLGLAYSVDGTLVRVYRRELDTRIFDLNYIAMDRVGSTAVRGGDAGTVSVTTTTKGDVFTELAAGVRALLSEQATFNVDRKAGLLQVTDTPERLDRVAVYLEAVQDRVHRQAQIDVRVLEVTLHDEKARGVDWTALTVQLTGDQPRPGARPTLTGMRVTNIARFVTLLEVQGSVATLSNPRLMAMNNEPSIVKTDAMTLAVTAQIASDSLLTLSVSPILKAPATAESDLLARVADGETLVVTGFGLDRETHERKATGSSGGWFGRSTVVTKKRVELVILLTPRIVPGIGVP
jgi:type II secretory pathway component GspD/PulD (secretin)